MWNKQDETEQPAAGQALSGLGCSVQYDPDYLQKKSYDQPRQYIKKQRHYFADKGPSSQSYDSILKSRDITLLTKVRLVKAMVFPVVIYGCESWTIKKVEHRRIDAFELSVGEDF